MKFIKLLLIILSAAYIGGCGGSDSIKPSVDTEPATIATTKAAADGTISFTGTGVFEGFSVSAVVPAMAGKTVYIEKTDAAYVKDGYTALSPVFSVRFTEKASSATPSATYDASVTLPYTLSGTASDANTVFLAVINNSAIVQPSTKPAAGIIRASTDIPFSFFAGYLNEAETPAVKKFIRLLSKSHREALADGEYFTDRSNNRIPDVIRGTENVQPGEKVALDIDQTALGGAVLNVQWTVQKSGGAFITPDTEGTKAVFIPDSAGTYTVTATVTGSTETVSESLTVKAYSYSYDKNNSKSFCLLFCHNGSVNAPEHKDMYGREIMRNIQDAWSASAHAGAYNSSVTSANSTECAACHGTGNFFADRDSNGTDDFPSVFGFDDTMTTDTNASTASVHLRGVTCEACHGPAATFAGGLSGTMAMSGHPSSISISSGVCLTCHDIGTRGGHFAEFYDASGESTHENAHTLANSNVVNNEACFSCHSGEGALGMLLGEEITRADTDRISGITCNVCHDPHGEGGHNAQLRVSGSHTLTVYSGNVTVNAGDGKICYTCHNTDGAGIGTLPHNSQAEMFEGKGGYTYGETLALTSAHKSSLDCADCHMNRSAGTTHSMAMSSNRSDRLDYCNSSCHSGVTADADGRYDYLGRTAGVRTLMNTLKERINTLAGRALSSEISASYSVTGNTALTNALNRAAYNYNFIISDKSFGLHNYSYAAKLLELSINDLTSF
ncbi:MAG: hypothetical protein AB7E48_12160 [Deferribacterales bacterium]